MISILVPTMNRPDFVGRLLRYYAELRFPYFIMIGDSSDENHQKAVLSAVEKYNSKIHIKHVFYPGFNNYQVFQALLEEVSTPYASYLADDDFLVPDVLEDCLRFMETHPDYVGACGKAILFALQNSGPYGFLKFIEPYGQHSIEDDTPEERLQFHVRRYTSTFHAVCRTKALKIALRNASRMNAVTDKTAVDWLTVQHFSELLTSWSLVIQGKLKVFDSLYYVRQHHARRYFFSDLFDWITSANWGVCYQIFREQLVEELVRKDVPLEEAQAIFKKAFLLRLAMGFQKINAARFPWQKSVKGFLRRRWNAISRPHYHQFKPIHSFVTSSHSGEQ